MQQNHHPLLSPSLGSQKSLASLHYGTPGARPKVYLQASLHAEELPGMLVAHHLRSLLQAAEAAGHLIGEVVLVPVANPIGLAQRIDHKPMGRFELDTSENFNRHYPDLAKAVWSVVQSDLGTDPQTNIAIVRRAMGNYLRAWVPDTELQSLRRTLLLLAHDADFMLDLHCDCEAVMHFYTEESCWPQLESLTRLLQCQTVLLAKNSGSGPIDECLSGAWWRLVDLLGTIGNSAPLPQGCCSATIELRGEADVSHALATADAQAIFCWLQHAGVIACDVQPALPPALCQATPLAGSETLRTTLPGIVVFAAQVGQTLQTGELVAEVIDPIGNQTHRVVAGITGVFYARIRERYALAGAELGKIAGVTAFKTGELLGA